MDWTTEIEWIKKILEINLNSYFNPSDAKVTDIETHCPKTNQFYLNYIEKYSLNTLDRFIIGVAMTSILKPDTFELLMTSNPNSNFGYPAFGGIIDNNRFIPTFRTLSFITGDYHCLKILEKCSPNNPLFKNEILNIGELSLNNFLEQPINLYPKSSFNLLNQKEYEINFSPEFPAKKIETSLDWNDFICSTKLKNQLNEIINWHKCKETFKTNSHYVKWIKSGYRILFHGSSGTGKTLAAILIGKQLQIPIYRVDLSMIISKYIGETVKNLSKIFDKAESNEWILFFDEADSLFGKRSKTENSNDRHSNQEIGFLLQRIENYDGLIILATNLKNNMDEAFSRRFQSILQFKKPNQKERLELWKSIFTPEFGLSENFLIKMSKKHEITGGNLINILQKTVINSKEFNEEFIEYTTIEEIKKLE